MHEDSFYGVQARFLIAVDCTILGFIDNEIKLLTFRRKIEPKKGGLSLLGGFMNENEKYRSGGESGVEDFDRA